MNFLPLYITYPSWIHPEVFPGVPMLGLIRWYGLMYICAFTTAFWVLKKLLKEGALDYKNSDNQLVKATEDDIFSFIATGIVFLLIGARVFSTLVYDTSGKYLRTPWLIFWPFDSDMHFTGLAGMTRNIRASMIDTLSMDYIRTARAKGLKERTVIYSHAWRNALLPVVTSIIGWFLSIFGGSFVIENTFLLHGMGRLYIQALQNNDFELVLASQMFNTVVSLVGILITDLAYGLVDPRVRVDK